MSATRGGLGKGTRLIMFDGTTKSVEDIVADFNTGKEQLLASDDGKSRKVVSVYVGNTAEDHKEHVRSGAGDSKWPPCKDGWKTQRGPDSDGRFACKYVGCMRTSSTKSNREIHELNEKMHQVPGDMEPGMFKITPAGGGRTSWVCTSEHGLSVRWAQLPTAVEKWHEREAARTNPFNFRTWENRNGKIRRYGYSFDTFERATISRDDFLKTWKPLDINMPLASFLQNSKTAHVEAQMFKPALVEFEIPRQSLHSRFRTVFSVSPTCKI